MAHGAELMGFMAIENLIAEWENFIGDCGTTTRRIGKTQQISLL